MVLVIGITAAGLTIAPAKASQLLIDSGGGSVTDRGIIAAGERNNFTGGGNTTKSRTLGGGQRHDYIWDRYDILIQPLQDGFRLHNGGEPSYGVRAILDDGYGIYGQ